MDLFFDKEFRQIIPPLQPDELTQLEASLKVEGNRDPIVIWKEKNLLLDGHNRYDLCHKNNIDLKPPIELSFKNRVAAQIWIIRNQFGRRNLNNYQRSVLALRLKRILATEAKKKQSRKGNFVLQNSVKQKANTQKELATIADVSHDTISKVETIEAKSTLEQKTKLAKGDATINKVYQDTMRHEAFLNNQVELAKLVEEAQALPQSDKFQIFIGDFATISSNNEIAPESIDAIITDPPWTKETMHTYSQLAEISLRVLKPGGIVLAMVGHTYMPEAIARMSQHLKYWWTIAYMLPGEHARAWAYKTINQWKPILFFVKDRYKGQWIFDVIYSEQREKRFHAWQSSDSGMKSLVENTTKPNDLILDPFMGSGATGIAALNSNRRFIGIELSEETAKLAEARLSKISNGKEEVIT